MTELTRLKSTLTCDILTLRNISKADLAKEAGLLNTCWWAYRGVHPARRTQLFANTYRRQYQRFYGKYYDASKAEYVSGVGGAEDIFRLEDYSEDEEVRARRERAKRQNLTGFWRARQTADALGISYSVYIRSIFEAACSRWRNMASGGHLKLPRPTHLYSERNQVIALDAQAKEIEGYIPDLKLPHLMKGSKAPHKQDFDQWLFELGKLRIHKDLAYKRMVDIGYIDEATARAWEQAAKN